MTIMDLFRRLRFWLDADRLGPDMPLTHLCLYFPGTMRLLCRKKFKRFGEGAEFRPGGYAICCSKISIGDNVVIRPGTMLFADPCSNGAGIVIEDDVLIGSGVHFYCNNHRYDDPYQPIIRQGYCGSRPITLKRGCWVGANVVLLPGITIGENAVVGAGSIVTKDIPSKVVAAGNPARIIKPVYQIPAEGREQECRSMASGTSIVGDGI